MQFIVGLWGLIWELVAALFGSVFEAADKTKSFLIRDLISECKT